MTNTTATHRIARRACDCSTCAGNCGCRPVRDGAGDIAYIRTCSTHEAPRDEPHVGL